MTANRIAREIKQRILLSGEVMNVPAGDFFALVYLLIQSTREPRVGFNHATTNLEGWMNSFAPYGLNMDKAFVEDLLYGANMLNEIKKFSHPQGKTFEQMLRTVLRPNQAFDSLTNSIQEKIK